MDGVISGKITIDQLQLLVTQWADATFDERREDAAWKKLFEELGEVLRAPDDPEEWADVFILLFDLSAMHGINIGRGIIDKLDKNRRRVWRKTGTGVYQHEESQTKPKR